MALQQAVGTTLGISAALPATWDEAGFVALTYATVGRITSVPPLSVTYDVATFDDLGTGEEIKFSDMMRAGDGAFVVGLDSEDAGQIIVEANQGEKVAICITLKGGAKYYRTGIILSYNPSNISVGGVVQAEVNMAFEKVTVKVAAP